MAMPWRRAAEPLRSALGREGAVSLLVFLGALLPRIPFRAAGLFHVDEVFTARAVERLVNEGVLTGEVNGRYGTVLLTALFHLPHRALAGGGTEASIVALGVLCGALGVLLAYLLLRDLAGSRRLALLAAAVLNFHALYLVTSTTGKEHGLLLVLLLLAFLLLLRGARRDSLPLRVLGMASYAAALSVHEAALPFAPVLLAFLLYTGEALAPPGAKRRRIAEPLLFLALSAIPVLLYLGAEAWRLAAAPGSGAARIAPLSDGYLAYTSGKLLDASGWPFVALLLPGLVLSYRRRPLFVLLLLWLPLALWFGNLHARSERYFLFVLPPLCALPAAAAEAAAERIARPFARRAVVAAAAAILCGHGVATAYPALAARAERLGPRAVALFLRENTEPDASVLVMDEAPFVEYFGGRATLLHPIGGPVRLAPFVEEVRERVLRGEHVYMAHSALTYDDDGYLQEMLDEAVDYVPVGIVPDELWVRDIVRYNPTDQGIFRLVPPAPRPGTLARIPVARPERTYRPVGPSPPPAP